MWSPRAPAPPARRGDVVDDHHGTRVPDPYRWLEDPDGEETRAWVAAQNARTRAALDAVPARDRIRDRLAELWDHPRRSTPWREGDRWFQLRNTGLQDQDVLWVLPSAGEHGEVLLDPNALSDDGTVALAAMAPSRDGTLLAYALSEDGSDWMTWRVRRTDGGDDLPDELRWSKFAGAAWAPDGSGFFYAAYDPPPPGEALSGANRGHRLWFHRLGTDQGADVLVHERPDRPDWIVDPTVTEDGRWLVVDVAEGTDHRNRVWAADLAGWADGGPEGLELRPLLDDFDGGWHLAGNVGGLLYFHTDAGAPRGRLVAVPVDQPERRLEVVPEAEATLEGAQLLGGRIVATYLDDAQHRLQRFALDGRDEGTIALPGIGSVEGLAGRQSDRVLHLQFTSFTTPVGVCRHDLDTGETTWLHPPGLDVDQERYETEQVVAESADGTRVPLFLVRRRDVPHPTAEAPVEVPTLLWGYGGFGIPVTPVFRVWWLVWLELGGQLAVAVLRGGGEYGEQWHAAGRGAGKQRVFDDFVACAEALVESGWTTSARLAINGGSNGGLLVGACMTQRPELFGACVPEVGVLDMLRFHRFTIGWAWVSDYGSADDPEGFRILLGYSPLHNLWPRTAYPATLVVTGDHDDRVVPAHSFKFGAALQAAQGGDAPVLVRVQTDAGHGAGTPTRVRVEERADVLAFLVAALDVPVPGG